MAPCIIDDVRGGSVLKNNIHMPEDVDTVVVGNGPSALILSYLLHGHVPCYDPISYGPHPDPILHTKLSSLLVSLYSAVASPSAIDVFTEHFQGSRFPYSTQALPVNVLLDTLLRPNADTACGEVHSRIRWSYEPDNVVSHAVFGCTRRPGGQWSDGSVLTSDSDIEALSYAEMLSLPGYTFADMYRERHTKTLPEFSRPSQNEISDYLATYPARVGIEDSVYSSIHVDHIERSASGEGFTVDISRIVQDNKNNREHTKDSANYHSRIHCRHLVLASGIFSHIIRSPKLLHPLTTLPKPPPPTNNHPLLVVGSGFSAADIITSTLPRRKVLHLFRWSPETHPSPLRSCHRQAYPEYAAVYRRMKLASSRYPVVASNKGGRGRKIGVTISPMLIRRCSSHFAERDWDSMYEGLPNAEVVEVDADGDSVGGIEVTIQLPDGSGMIHRRVSGLEYLVGRRGSLNYLSDSLKNAILPEPSMNNGPITQLISAKTLRPKAALNLEVAPSVFVIGSLSGDSLIRFAFGGCVYAAGKIIRDAAPLYSAVAMLDLQNSSGKPVLNGCGGDTADRGCSGRSEDTLAVVFRVK